MWEITKIILGGIAVITGVFITALSLFILFLFSIGAIQLIRKGDEDHELTGDEMLEQ